MENLLLTLNRFFRPGQSYFREEDLFTEYLSWLLNASESFRVAFARLILDDAGAGFDPEIYARATAETQVGIKLETESRRPDLRLEVGPPDEDEDAALEYRALLLVECKDESPLRATQLEDYHAYLDAELNAQYDEVHLAALTKESFDEAPLRGSEYPHWRRRIFWSQVQQRLTDEVERAHRQLSSGADDDELEELAGFVCIGRQFADLLDTKGLVPPTKLMPRRDHLDYVNGELTEKRKIELSKLILRAANAAELANLFDKAGFQLRSFKNVEQAWAYAGVQLRLRPRPLNVLRLAYHLEGFKGSFVYFGLLLAQPYAGIRREGEEDTDPLGAIELIVCVEIPKKIAGSRPADRWLHSADGEHTHLDNICRALNRAIQDRDRYQEPFFVPEETDWTKLVRRLPLTGWEDREAIWQVDQMRLFFRESTDLLMTTEDPPYTQHGTGILGLLRRIHTEAGRSEIESRAAG